MGESSVSLRPATPGDTAAIARVWHQGWLDGHVGHVPEELVQHRGFDQFVTRAADRVPFTWVAEIDGAVVGFVTLKDDELEQIFVDGPRAGPESRRLCSSAARASCAPPDTARLGWRWSPATPAPVPSTSAAVGGTPAASSTTPRPQRAPCRCRRATNVISADPRRAHFLIIRGQ
jgi:hypothetical protein